MDFTSPWDDLDLDLVPPSRPIPRLKLSPPPFYFSLLPIRNPEQWEHKWGKANTAANMRAITTECIEHERKIVGYFEELEWTEPTSIAASTTPMDDPASEEAVSAAPTEEPEEVSSTVSSGEPPSVTAPPTDTPASTNPANDLAETTITNQLALNRQQNPGGFYIPIAKRVRFKETLEPACFNGPNPPVSIIALHRPIHSAVKEWHDLITRAESIEDDLLAIQSRLDVTLTSDMSEEELEEELKRIQTAAEKVVLKLDEAAYAVHEALGVNSEAAAQYKNEDPNKLFFLGSEYYDEKFEWQVRVYGLFAWWTKAIGGKMSAIM